ncbi:hypothetical protein MVES1_003787 [Malassezia vespertilionis]|uniref:CRA domain-containing protein n=1 Tax=Malassezia vespertilionis TaxID=2020962 RepID=A0A2N1J7L7_9BASI|nr:uncharacterized protein MVES1_003787 [Malassezia vespertilionis]PKI82534.1 hypothetical protein MVES_003343 [Malassezia vespertilionis]WFD08415.1 hypothetical protein MVES1_003787 [Malassezia vespertilionis]
MNDAGTVRQLVLDYLLHHGHTATASAYMRDRQGLGDVAHAQPVCKGNMEARQQVRAAIMDGRIEEAVALCDDHFSGVLRSMPVDTPPSMDLHDAALRDDERAIPAHALSLDPFHLWLNLHMQHYIEVVRALYDDYARDETAEESPLLKAALDVVQMLNTHVQYLALSDRDAYAARLDQLATLLAFSDAQHIPQPEIFDPQRRAALAAQVNAALLAYEGLPSDAVLANLVRQATYVLCKLHADKIPIPRDHALVTLGESAGMGQFLPAPLPSSSGTARRAATSAHTVIVPPWRQEQIWDAP